jgi:hypothetical protein
MTLARLPRHREHRVTGMAFSRGRNETIERQASIQKRWMPLRERRAKSGQ